MIDRWVKIQAGDKFWALRESISFQLHKALILVGICGLSSKMPYEGWRATPYEVVSFRLYNVTFWRAPLRSPFVSITHSRSKCLKREFFQPLRSYWLSRGNWIRNKQKRNKKCSLNCAGQWHLCATFSNCTMYVYVFQTVRSDRSFLFCFFIYNQITDFSKNITFL